MNVSVTLPIQGDHNLQYNHGLFFPPCSLSLLKSWPVCMQYIVKVDFTVSFVVSLSVATSLFTCHHLPVTVTINDDCIVTYIQ